MTDATVLTERESCVIAQALYEFIRLEQSKPRDLRRLSDEHCKGKGALKRFTGRSVPSR